MRNIQEFTLTDPRAVPGQAGLHRFARFRNLPDQAGRVDFLEVLHDAGPYALLKRSGKSLLKASYQQAYSADRPYDELVDATDYYLRSPDGTFTAVKPTTKSLVAAIPPVLQESLRAELKKTPVRTETDLVNAVSQLNKLAAVSK
ncbi:hypothetical protein [Hymenobacter guriensis]|uniref:Uncharacterized protein n=1 Tax=Hymenobacter guriensis TaxID=2793065 RepID=A0ABS0L421_9BACT|nr:hypothetical protein [Hymenobacter guriensis]MBG8554885.1 hypothetical protein [Hymenobacter guriensis]